MSRRASSASTAVLLLGELLLAVSLAAPLRAQETPPSAATPPSTVSPQVTTTVGMEGSFFLVHRGERLFSKPLPREGETENVPPFLVWILDRTPDGDAVRYELRFCGNEPGDYDLGDFLENEKGERARGLQPMPVRVLALLPEDHKGDLVSPRPVDLPGLGGYQTVLWILAVIWAIPVVYWLGRAAWRRRPVARPEPVVEPTLADQLRPIVEAAVARKLDAAGQARLERMLLAHWRDRLNLRGLPHLEALRRMKADPAAGALLVGLEGWLHRPAGDAHIDVESLLAAYRTERPVEERELALAQAGGGR